MIARTASVANRTVLMRLSKLPNRPVAKDEGPIVDVDLHFGAATRGVIDVAWSVAVHMALTDMSR